MRPPSDQLRCAGHGLRHQRSLQIEISVLLQADVHRSAAAWHSCQNGWHQPGSDLPGCSRTYRLFALILQLHKWNQSGLFSAGTLLPDRQAQAGVTAWRSAHTLPVHCRILQMTFVTLMRTGAVFRLSRGQLYYVQDSKTTTPTPP